MTTTSDKPRTKPTEPEALLSQVAAKEKEKPPFTHVTVILSPESDKRTGPYRFTWTIEVPPKGRDKEPTVEVAGKFLVPGANEVTVEECENMQKSDFWERCVKKGVVRVHVPQIEPSQKQTRTTADYSVEDAIAIIDESSDVKWLERCINKDSRDGIVEACQARIKLVERELEERKAAGDD